MYEEFSSPDQGGNEGPKLSQKGFYELCKQHFDEGTSFSLRSLSSYTGEFPCRRRISLSSSPMYWAWII